MNTTHRDYEPFELAENMEEDLGMFEAATHAKPLQLASPQVGKILVALDGSNQDPTAQALGQQLAARVQATVEQQCDCKRGSDVRDAIQQTRADVLILPVPFGEDIDLLASQSLGSVADTLLQDCPVPMLCVRQPLEAAGMQLLFDQILLPLAVHNSESERSLAWACWLAGNSGELLLLELADQALAEKVRTAEANVEESTAERKASLGREMSTRMASLVSAAQRSSTEQGFGVRTEFRAGRPVAEVEAMLQEFQTPLVITTRSSDRTSAQFHFVIDLLLQSRCPVLLV